MLLLRISCKRNHGLYDRDSQSGELPVAHTNHRRWRVRIEQARAKIRSMSFKQAHVIIEVWLVPHAPKIKQSLGCAACAFSFRPRPPHPTHSFVHAADLVYEGVCFTSQIACVLDLSPWLPRHLFVGSHVQH